MSEDRAVSGVDINTAPAAQKKGGGSVLTAAVSLGLTTPGSTQYNLKAQQIEQSKTGMANIAPNLPPHIEEEIKFALWEESLGQGRRLGNFNREIWRFNL
jgi:hypothetical protein